MLLEIFEEKLLIRINISHSNNVPNVLLPEEFHANYQAAIGRCDPRLAGAAQGQLHRYEAEAAQP